MLEKSYEVSCPRCGTKSEVKHSLGYGNPRKSGVESGVIETQIPIRCPHCLMRLNFSAEAFRGRLERKE